MKRTKLTTREKMLFALPLLVLVVPLASALKPGDEGLDEAMRQLSGPNAVDCDQKQNALLMNECMFTRFKSSKPFRAHLKNLGRQNHITGVVMTPQGQLYDLEWERGSWFSKGRIVSVYHVHNLLKDYNGPGTYGQHVGPELTPDERNKLLHR